MNAQQLRSELEYAEAARDTAAALGYDRLHQELSARAFSLRMQLDRAISAEWQQIRRDAMETINA